MKLKSIFDSDKNPVNCVHYETIVVHPSWKAYGQVYPRRHEQGAQHIHAKNVLSQHFSIALKLYMQLLKIFQVSSQTGKTILYFTWHNFIVLHSEFSEFCI